MWMQWSVRPFLFLLWSPTDLLSSPWGRTEQSSGYRIFQHGNKFPTGLCLHMGCFYSQERCWWKYKSSCSWLWWLILSFIFLFSHNVEYISETSLVWNLILSIFGNWFTMLSLSEFDLWCGITLLLVLSFIFIVCKYKDFKLLETAYFEPG